MEEEQLKLQLGAIGDVKKPGVPKSCRVTKRGMSEEEAKMQRQQILGAFGFSDESFGQWVAKLERLQRQEQATNGCTDSDSDR